MVVDFQDILAPDFKEQVERKIERFLDDKNWENARKSCPSWCWNILVNHQTFEASMTELASLAATAGAVVTTIFTQKKERLDGKYLAELANCKKSKIT